VKGFVVQGSGFVVQGSGFRVQGTSFHTTCISRGFDWQSHCGGEVTESSTYASSYYCVLTAG